jgi:ATP-dependent DNA helicase RecQ
VNQLLCIIGQPGLDIDSIVKSIKAPSTAEAPKPASPAAATTTASTQPSSPVSSPAPATTASATVVNEGRIFASPLAKKIAKEKNLPPYVIFQDPSLEEMATTYPTTQDEMAQINGVGMGKVVKFGKPFLEVINRYVEENEIETAKEVVVKSTVNKSKIKIYIIQQVDRKIDLDLIAEQKEVSMSELIEEIETICFSGTKLNLDYYINQVIELDKQEEIYEYFMSADTDNIAEALENCDIEDVTEEELRLMRIKFLSELAN